ncbi:unnamed protein product [Acanthoscelides obtectus]|uniref:THAP-type domain-containing protein n=1 Tax=Acanthoscelides obtectus TaxID=200917 RepID=A0A9P0M1V4_ACAOB|nr:unnamed protein product [Acanthoscelides obtectus]CAK1657416.1 52 kDa repressor of the inhibitor of the protein kinase [Acanthoscelides obtectus]
MSGVRRCAALDCLNTAENSDYSLFRFPLDIERAKIWIKACNREDLLPKIQNLHNTSYRVCGEHFSQKMFANKSRTRLRKNVNPDIFLSLGRPSTVEVSLQTDEPRQKPYSCDGAGR